MGGFTAYLAACRCDVAVAVAFYGGGIVKSRPGIGFGPIIDETPQIKAPILCLFGSNDPSIPREDVDAIDSALKHAGNNHKIVVYPDAGHGFCCDARDAYNPAASAKSWSLAIEWLQSVLKIRASDLH